MARLARLRLLDGRPILQVGVKDGLNYGIVTDVGWPQRWAGAQDAEKDRQKAAFQKSNYGQRIPRSLR